MGFIHRSQSFKEFLRDYATAFSCSSAVDCCRRLLLKLNAGMLLPRSQSLLLSFRRLPGSLIIHAQQRNIVSSHRPNPVAGTTTPVPDDATKQAPKSPFYFDTGYALFAKRPSRPFPPPFLSRPSGSFSDPLTTHDQSRDRRSYVNGEMIRGITNGDDAVLVEENFIGANDGVGAWATREKGHAP